jgi:hypothetical protein
VPLGVAPRDAERRGRDVEGDGVRVRAFVEERDRDAARTRPHVADERRVSPAQDFERRLDQKLRLRPRDEHVGRHLEVEPVELLMPRDVLQGLARRAALDEILELSPLLRRHLRVVVREQVSPVPLQRVRQQRSGLAPRLRHAHHAQHARRLPQGSGNRLGFFHRLISQKPDRGGRQKVRRALTFAFCLFTFAFFTVGFCLFLLRRAVRYNTR